MPTDAEMAAALSDYAFRPVTQADLALLRRWRRRPHVVEYWGPAEVEDPGHVLADPRVAMWIVEHRGRPFAYAQDYSPTIGIRTPSPICRPARAGSINISASRTWSAGAMAAPSSGRIATG